MAPINIGLEAVKWGGSKLIGLNLSEPEPPQAKPVTTRRGPLRALSPPRRRPALPPATPVDKALVDGLEKIGVSGSDLPKRIERIVKAEKARDQINKAHE